MQDERTSPRTKRLLERLKELWQYPHGLTYESVERILQELPEEDEALGIEALAEHLVSIMKLHFLDIVATFCQKAEEEEISAEERDGITRDVMPEAFQTIQKLGSQLSVQSLSDLTMLSNITFGLYTLSQVESAEEAERWMYKLAGMYHDRLQQEHLVIEPIHLTVKVSATPGHSTTPWNTALSQSSPDWTVKYQPSASIQSPSEGSRKPPSLVA